MNTTLLLATVVSCLASVGTCWGEPILAVVARGDGMVNFYRARSSGLQLVKSIPAGKRPGEMCLDPNGKRIFVGEVAEKSVAEIDLATQSVVAAMTDPVLKTPDGCTVSPDSSKLYMIDSAGDTVFVFSTSSHQLLAKISVGKEPRRALFSVDGKMLLVSNAHSDTISVIDPAADKVVREIKAGREPRDMLWTPDGKMLVVALVVDDSIAYFKADTLEFDRQVGTERSPQRLAITSDGGLLFSLSRYANAISVADLTESGERRFVSSIPVGRYAFNMTMSADGKFLYTANTQLDNTISVIDVRLMKVVNVVSGGNSPLCMLYVK
jgi:YVTN family beta-propeller protein